MIWSSDCTNMHIRQTIYWVNLCLFVLQHCLLAFTAETLQSVFPGLFCVVDRIWKTSSAFWKPIIRHRFHCLLKTRSSQFHWFVNMLLCKNWSLYIVFCTFNCSRGHRSVFQAIFETVLDAKASFLYNEGTIHKISMRRRPKVWQCMTCLL